MCAAHIGVYDVSIYISISMCAAHIGVYDWTLSISSVDDTDCEVTWMRNGKKLKKKKKSCYDFVSKDGTIQLVIAKATPEDGGNYHMTITNPTGSIDAEVEVVVEAAAQAPQIKHLPENFSVKTGEDILISCMITGQTNENTCTISCMSY